MTQDEQLLDHEQRLMRLETLEDARYRETLEHRALVLGKLTELAAATTKLALNHVSSVGSYIQREALVLAIKEHSETCAKRMAMPPMSTKQWVAGITGIIVAIGGLTGIVTVILQAVLGIK